MSLTPSGRFHLRTVRVAASAICIGLLASACGGGGGSSGTTTPPPPPPPKTYTIGGTISGLGGSGLVLQDNGGDNLTVASGSTTFTFATALASGSKYAVTVMASPSGQKCAVSNGSGTVNGANVTNVAVSCTSATSTFTIGGTISGLSGNGLVLQDNGGNNLTVASGATKFTFSQALTNGAAYKVTVSASPPGQKCTVTNGSGTVAGANVTTVAVACTTTAYSVSGTVTGLTGSGLVLQDNGGDNLPVAAPTGSTANFTFKGTLLNGAAYAVTVLTQPTAPVQRCTVTNGSGKIAGASVTNVQVACARVGQFVFVANNADGTQGDVTAFTINAQTGALTAVGGASQTLFPADKGPNGVVVDPSGQFVYVSNGGADDVSREMLNSDGTLTLQGQFSTTSTVPVALAITPADTFLYASGHGTSAAGVILGFSVNPLSGALTGVVNPNAPFPFAQAQLGIAIDPTSSLVFSAGDPHFLYINAIAADGTLTQTNGSGISDSSLEGINGVAVWPKGGSTGGYVYTSNNLSNNVGIFSYDSAGAPTLVGSAAAGAGTTGIAIDPSGKYLYVTNFTDGTLSGYSINAQTGALTSLGAAVATGNLTSVANPGPIDVKIDPSSQFLYCVNKLDGSISLFTIGATGALTLVNSYVSAPDGHGAGSVALAVY